MGLACWRDGSHECMHTGSLQTIGKPCITICNTTPPVRTDTCGHPPAPVPPDSLLTNRIFGLANPAARRCGCNRHDCGRTPVLVLVQAHTVHKRSSWGLHLGHAMVNVG